MPSPVQMRPLVVGLNAWPTPPVARITFLAVNSSSAPVRMSRAMQPETAPASSWRRWVVNHSS